MSSDLALKRPPAAVVIVRFDPERRRLMVTVPTLFADRFQWEFRGLGERTWRRTQRLWSMPDTSSIRQRVLLWCALYAPSLHVDWDVP